MFNVLLVALGGAIGSVFRHLVNLASLRLIGPNFPWGTVVVNVVGSFVMGVFIELLARRWQGSEAIRLFVATGILGGFTTFSAFSLDFAVLWERGAAGQARRLCRWQRCCFVAGAFRRTVVRAQLRLKQVWNMAGVEQIAVEPGEAGMRLDRWFKAHYPGLGFGELQKLLRSGQIRRRRRPRQGRYAHRARPDRARAAARRRPARAMPRSRRAPCATRAMPSC